MWHQKLFHLQALHIPAIPVMLYIKLCWARRKRERISEQQGQDNTINSSGAFWQKKKLWTLNVEHLQRDDAVRAASTYGRECASQRELEDPARREWQSSRRVPVPTTMSIRWRQRSSELQEQPFLQRFREGIFSSGWARLERQEKRCKSQVSSMNAKSQLNLLWNSYHILDCSKLVSKCSDSLLKLDQLTEQKKAGELLGTSASYWGISLAHLWWKCLVCPTLSADLTEDRSISRALETTYHTPRPS